MSEKGAKHFIASLVTALGLIIYVVGYASGVRGWWLTVVLLAGLYALAYTLIDT